MLQVGGVYVVVHVLYGNYSFFQMWVCMFTFCSLDFELAMYAKSLNILSGRCYFIIQVFLVKS